jgi:lipopolysaccharide transport system ATP-binding protein
MYDRLAFAVAAHLESQILIVDEVLAVGDAEFQKRCLGKMKDVSRGEGRTVLFVSHNMTAVKSLCTKAIMLTNGTLGDIGETEKVIDGYLASTTSGQRAREIDCTKEPTFGNACVRFLKVAVESDGDVIRVNDAVNIYFEFESLVDNGQLNMSLVLYDRNDTCVFNVGSAQVPAKQGLFSSRCYIPSDFLNDEFYRVRILVVKDSAVPLIDISDIITFQINDIDRGQGWQGKWIGAVRPRLRFDLNNTDHAN